MSEPAIAGCPECSWIGTQLAPGESYTCRACSMHHERAKPKRVRTPRIVHDDVRDEDVRAFWQELLRYIAAVESIERAAGLSTSTWMLGVLEAPEYLAKLGHAVWRGSGNRGTKGTGRAPAIERVPAHVDPISHVRYLALTGEAKRTADAIAADGRGDQVVEMPFGRRWSSDRWVEVTLSLSLEQRIAFACVDAKQVGKWARHIAAGDSGPALKGSAESGTCRIHEATRAWFSR